MADVSTAFWERSQTGDIVSGGGDIWDTLLIDGEVVPGIASVKGSLKFDVDVKKAKGKDKASTTDNGITPTEFEVTIKVWSAAQWRDVQAIFARLLPRTPGGARTPFRVEHPGLRICNIGKAILKEFEIPQPKRAGELYEQSFKFIEWVPAPATVKTGGTGSKAAPKSTFNPFSPDPPLKQMPYIGSPFEGTRASGSV